MTNSDQPLDSFEKTSEKLQKPLTNISEDGKSKNKVEKEPVSSRVKARERAKNLRKTRTRVEDQNLIQIDQEPGWYYHRFNDTPGRIELYQKHGYEIVESKFNGGSHRSKDSSQMGASAVQDVGGGMKAYYMRIPKEIHEEDQARKQRKLNERDEQIASQSLKEVKDPRTKKSFRNYDVPGKGNISSRISFNEDDIDK